jgi:hypothetical protein
MRLFGFKSPLTAFRWDLIYLIAQLASDERPGVAELAPPLQALLEEMNIERAAYEEAEGDVIIAAALLDKKDQRRDKALIAVGGVARATDLEGYKLLFPRLNPSLTARLSIDEESIEVARILGELGKLPPENPLRLLYEKELTESEALVKAAGAQSDATITAFALQRSQLDRFKLKIDQQRLTTHGNLLILLKSKGEADAFYRPTATPPGDPVAKAPQAPATAQAPTAASIASK